ncbi:hypothetical protein DFH27DRAFT_527389 [Peziza echinospora]|nr:hypothetical protein DFH27DRAFT_527389 [Peziza echinospora]
MTYAIYVSFPRTYLKQEGGKYIGNVIIKLQGFELVEVKTVDVVLLEAPRARGTVEKRGGSTSQVGIYQYRSHLKLPTSYFNAGFILMYMYLEIISTSLPWVASTLKEHRNSGNARSREMTAKEMGPRDYMNSTSIVAMVVDHDHLSRLDRYPKEVEEREFLPNISLITRLPTCTHKGLGMRQVGHETKTNVQKVKRFDICMSIAIIRPRFYFLQAENLSLQLKGRSLPAGTEFCRILGLKGIEY